jgi:unsaturated rhamnogalacturonyl hydrolase
MKVKILLWIFSYLLFQITVNPVRTGAADPGSRWSVRMAESLITYGTYQSIWYYVDATTMKGFRNLWQATGEESYFQYIKDAIDSDSSNYQNINSLLINHDIDYINGGSLILFMYSQTGELRYQLLADSTLKFLKSFPRTSDSGFYHKDCPRMQVDDLYMGSPFLAEYGQIFDSPEEYKEAVKQALIMEKHTRDSATGLYHHAWYETEWHGNEAGCTPIFWGRGVGWVAMALVDMLDFLPEDYSGRDSAIAIFQRLAEAISKVQDNSTGVWWQVLDQGGRSENFLESSASCMFVYALAKGIRLGYIDKSYWEVVERGYYGILDNFIRDNGDGTISITNVCPGQSPGNFYQMYVGYIGENGHAAGPFIMASVEIEMKGLPPSNLRAVTISDKQVNLYWKDISDDEDGFRIERASEGEFTEIAVIGANTESYHDSILSPLTAYKYRIRTFKGDTNSVYSDIVTAITLAENGAPAYASQPDPADGATSVNITSLLSWLPGAAATSHDVYF